MTQFSNRDIHALTVDELESQIRYHNRLYWDLNTPEISDVEYDRLVGRLKDLAPESPVLQEMGPSEVGRIGTPVSHITPMLSLDKCYTDKELEAWAAKFEGDVLVTPKMDGIAASLLYNPKGILTVAATRGNGLIGDNITANAKTISDIPQDIG
jgi:DNA ligase (NAD+)